MGTVSRVAGIFAYGVVVVAFRDNYVFDLAPSSSDSDGIVEIRRLPDALQSLLVRNICNGGNISSLFFGLTTVLCRDGFDLGISSWRSDRNVYIRMFSDDPGVLHA
jgi:hypothetical protein